MNSRRGFFKRLAQAAAVIALAPQIAFKAPAPKLDLNELFQNVYRIKEARGYSDQIDIFTDQWTANRIQDDMLRYYKEHAA